MSLLASVDYFPFFRLNGLTNNNKTINVMQCDDKDARDIETLYQNI